MSYKKELSCFLVFLMFSASACNKDQEDSKVQDPVIENPETAVDNARNEVEPDVASNDTTPSTYNERHDKMLEDIQSELNEHQKDIEERFRQWKIEREVSRQARVVDETVKDKEFCSELRTLRRGLLEGYKRINAGAVARLSRITVWWFSSTENRQTVIQEMLEMQNLGERFGSASFDHIESSEEMKNQTKAALSASLVSLSLAAKTTDTPLFDEAFGAFQLVKEGAVRLLNMSTSITP